MDLLESVVSRAALRLFLEGNGFPTALERMNLGEQIADFQLLKSAKDPRSAFWSRVSQMETEYNTVYRQYKTMQSGRLTKFRVGSWGNLQIVAANLVCLLAICYKTLGEDLHMEEALDRWDSVHTVKRGDWIDKAVAYSGVGHIVFMPDIAISLFNQVDLFVAKENWEEFKRRLRAMPEFDFESLFCSSGDK